MPDYKQSILFKRGHTYLFRYRRGEEEAMVQVFIERASDPTNPLDWFDAAILAHQMGMHIAGGLKGKLKT